MYLSVAYHATATYLPAAYHAINQHIYQLYVMQSISTVEADSKVILLLVNFYVQLLADYL